MSVPLTVREKEILKMITEELSSSEIASLLGLSIRTVETHRKNIYRKADTDNLVGLIKYSIRMKMIEGFTYSSPARAVTKPLQRTA